MNSSLKEQKLSQRELRSLMGMDISTLRRGKVDRLETKEKRKV